LLGPGTVQTPPLVSAPVTVSTRRGVTEGSVRDALDIEALSHHYGAMVLRRCRRLLGDEEEALDASQDVFLRVLERRDRLEAAYPSSLLFRIATNVCLNRIRDRGRRPATRDEALLASIACAESPGAGSEASLILDWLFGRQPESSRTIAVLHFVDGLTLEEVARQTNLSVSGVRKRLRKLRELVSDDMVRLKPDATDRF
jgi:RNA polymerase sigma factor (sigma-70 family)